MISDKTLTNVVPQNWKHVCNSTRSKFSIKSYLSVVCAMLFECSLCYACSPVKKCSVTLFEQTLIGDCLETQN